MENEVDSLSDEYLDLDNNLGETIQDSALVALRPQGKSASGRPLPPSKEPFDTKGYLAFQSKTLDNKREYLKQQWLDMAYITLYRGKLFARSVTKKDYGKLVQLLMAAGISWDKAFPKGESLGVNNLTLNLFNGLPREKLTKVIGDVPLPSEKPLDSL